MKYDLTVSIVLYKNSALDLMRTIDSVYSTELSFKLFLVDNSPTNELEKVVRDNRTEYIFNGNNLGFGKAHNIIFTKIVNDSKYHLVLNPDVTFEGTSLQKLFSVMEDEEEIGIIQPKVFYPDGRHQYVNKRLPHPLDLFARRFFFGFLNGIVKKRMDIYEMRDKNLELKFEVPSVSGCFMFLRVAAIKKVGFFDERYFMYAEDIDLSRRMLRAYKNIYYPHASIIHGHARESYRINRLFFIHISSVIKYFNKWGWFFDREKEMLNNRTL